jgi:SAM-dependent methyltransferase
MTGTNVLQADSDIKVNVGCGATPTPGWINFDNSFSIRLARFPALSAALQSLGLLPTSSAELTQLGRSGDVRFANASARIPCADGTASVVYSSHMIEHLDRSQARTFLAEVRRVLRPGGVVRIAAPDLSRLVSEYLENGDADRFISGSHLGLDRYSGLKSWLKWTLVGPRHHLWMYDGESLARLIGAAGFAEAAVVPAGSTRIAEPGQLDLWERASESVYVEAVRPK